MIKTEVYRHLPPPPEGGGFQVGCGFLNRRGTMNDYIILKELSSEKLAENVSNKIKQGYSLVGGVSVAVDKLVKIYAQALIKES